MAYHVAVIGSFRQYYDEVVRTIKILQNMGLNVTSPKGAKITNSIEQFVIFETDNPEYTPEEIQMITLEKILSADAVYVCNPYGYVGKTTCYEIGFCYSRNKPLYFKELPIDLPMPVQNEQIVTPEQFGKLILKNEYGIYNNIDMCMPAKKSMETIFGENNNSTKVAVEDKKIVICGSMMFFKEMSLCRDILRKNGLKAIVPKEENDIIEAYDEVAFREFKRKVSKAYLKKIREKDTSAVLIYNGTKKGQENYIGANTLVEIAMAFAWNRKIYLFNDVYVPLADELLAWECICLNGNIEQLIFDMKKEVTNTEEFRQLTLFEQLF